ncbi:MAG: GAF domain-containing protein [Chloroflexi bacterium]|nr:GAF domain-containing protein [Chloroflexota bacterium]
MADPESGKGPAPDSPFSIPAPPPDPTDMTSMLGLVVLSAVQILRGSAGAIALRDDSGPQLSIRASYGLSDEVVAALHPRLDETIVGTLGQVGEQVSLAWRAAAASWAQRERIAQILGLPLTETSGKVIGVIYVFRHPTAARFEPTDLDVLNIFARQATATIQQVRLTAATLAERQRLESMQSSFVSIVSHELQTPVSIIKAYAGTLARPDGPWSRDTVIRVAHTIEEECDRLYRLISDLLDISKIQAGRVGMTIGPVDLPEMADTLAERSRPRSADHRFVTDFPPDFPVIRGDREKLRQALGNLIDNAIKYSPSGGSITLGGRAERDHVILYVRDQGIGIPRDEQGRVFERFHRVDTRLSRSTQGVGLGLYITRVIVEAHGGQIWVESAGANQGSTFYIRLPR